jgi:predicted nucleic acid-binding Zn ribbon protein
VQPPAGLSDVFYRWQGRLLPLVTYSCTDCAEDYTFAQGGQDLATALEQAQHREPCWH